MDALIIGVGFSAFLFCQLSHIKIYNHKFDQRDPIYWLLEGGVLLSTNALGWSRAGQSRRLIVKQKKNIAFTRSFIYFNNGNDDSNFLLNP